MRVRITILFLVLAMLAAGWPAAAAPPEGTLAIGVHVTLVSRWLDPGRDGSAHHALHGAVPAP